MTGLSDYEVWQISIAERTASSISLISVVFVLLTYLFSPAFNKPINRQIFYATWSNLGICLAGLISVDGYLGGEDKPLCRFQAFLVQMYAFVELCEVAMSLKQAGFLAWMRTGPYAWPSTFTSLSFLDIRLSGCERWTQGISSSVMAHLLFQPLSSSSLVHLVARSTAMHRYGAG